MFLRVGDFGEEMRNVGDGVQKSGGEVKHGASLTFLTQGRTKRGMFNALIPR